MRAFLSALVLILACASCGDDGGGVADAGGGDDGGRPRRDSGGGTDSGGGSDAGGGVDSGPACSPMATPIPGCRPAVAPSTGDPRQDCVDRINRFRAECQCLPPLARWNDGEACADMHAQYDSERRVAHAGFRDNICSPRGNAQNECPGWGSIPMIISGCLQLMWDEGPGEPFEEHGHYLNMSSTRFSMVACGFYTTPGGEIWAVQNFR